MRAVFLLFLLFSGAANAALSVTHHGSVSNQGGTTTAINVDADAGDVIELCAVVRGSTGSIPALSIAGGSLTWGTRSTTGVVPLTGNGNGIGYRETCFYAPTSGALSGTTMTVTSDITIQNSSLGYIAVAGTALVPFDPDVGAVANANYVDASVSTEPTVTQTTSLAHDILLMATGSIASFDCGGITTTFGGSGALLGFTQASTAGLKTVCLGMSWIIVSVAQTAITDAEPGASGTTDWTSIVDAMTADTARRNAAFAPGFP